MIRCTCRRCVADALTAALNATPPRLRLTPGQVRHIERTARHDPR